MSEVIGYVTIMGTNVKENVSYAVTTSRWQRDSFAIHANALWERVFKKIAGSASRPQSPHSIPVCDPQAKVPSNLARKCTPSASRSSMACRAESFK